VNLAGLRLCRLRVGRRAAALDTLAVRLVNATYCRQGSLRSPGHGGRPVGTLTPGTTGRMSADGIALEKAIQTVEVPSGLG
jgi:hypothetical protein